MTLGGGHYKTNAYSDKKDEEEKKMTTTGINHQVGYDMMRQAFSNDEMKSADHVIAKIKTIREALQLEEDPPLFTQEECNVLASIHQGTNKNFAPPSGVYLMKEDLKSLLDPNAMILNAVIEWFCWACSVISNTRMMQKGSFQNKTVPRKGVSDQNKKTLEHIEIHTVETKFYPDSLVTSFVLTNITEFLHNNRIPIDESIHTNYSKIPKMGHLYVKRPLIHGFPVPSSRIELYKRHAANMSDFETRLGHLANEWYSYGMGGRTIVIYNHQLHWSVLIYDQASSKVYHYNSMRSNARSEEAYALFFVLFYKVLAFHANQKRPSLWKDKSIEFDFKEVETNLQQKDHVSCGAYLCYYVYRVIVKGAPLENPIAGDTKPGDHYMKTSMRMGIAEAILRVASLSPVFHKLIF